MNTTEFSSKLLSYQPILSGYAYKLTRNQANAEDLVQETFLKALQNEEKFNIDTNIKAWLFTILKNTFINDYRKRSRRDTVLSSDVHEYFLNNTPASSSPESDMNFNSLNKMVNSLEPEFKVPFQMLENGYRYQEIADKLGLNLGTVKSRIHFSRRKLMDKVAE